MFIDIEWVELSIRQCSTVLLGGNDVYIYVVFCTDTWEIECDKIQTKVWKNLQYTLKKMTFYSLKLNASK